MYVSTLPESIIGHSKTEEQRSLVCIIYLFSLHPTPASSLNQCDYAYMIHYNKLKLYQKHHTEKNYVENKRYTINIQRILFGIFILMHRICEIPQLKRNVYRFVFLINYVKSFKT